MKKSPVPVLAILLILALTAFTLTAVGQSGLTEPTPRLTTSEKHEIMGRAKAEKLDIRRNLEEYAKLALAANQTDFDVNYYGISIDVDIPSTEIFGDVTVQAKALVDALDEVQLDLVDDLTVDSVYVPGSGQLGYSHAGNILTVTLDQIYNSDDLFLFSVAYHGTPSVSGFIGFSFDVRYSIPVISSLSEPYMARSWWPCKDRPDDKADSLDISITCDTALYCASNGTLVDTVRNGDGSWTFDYEVRYPITTYLFSIAISKYTVWTDWYHYGPTDSMPVVNHVYPDQYMYSVPRWGVTPYAIGVFSDLFGQYPFVNEKYGHANFEWGGGMEHQTVTSMTGTWFGFDTNTVVHELAHQWWGDMITCNNWHEIWLNEGFASYSEALFWEVAAGEARYKDEMSDMEYLSAGTIYRTDTTDVWGIFSNIVYDKGAWVLHMLRHVVGDADFFDILQTYYSSQYQYGDATTAQFQAICEQVSGMDLDFFFDEWIYGNYYPYYQYCMATDYDQANNEYLTYVYLKQIQTSTPAFYTMPLEFGFTGGGEGDTIQAFVDKKDSVYVFRLPFTPAILTLDPDNWVLSRATTTTWTYHIIPLVPDTGTRYKAYLDTLRVKGGSGNNRFKVIEGNFPPGLVMDSTTGIITGLPTAWGDFDFKIESRDINTFSYKDTNLYSMNILPGLGIPGDANVDEAVDLLDILFLIDYKFKDGPAPDIPQLADVNNDCIINLLDILYLIDYKFKDGAEPEMGCAK